MSEPRPQQPPARVLDYPSAAETRQLHRDVKLLLTPQHWITQAFATGMLLAVIWGARFPGFEFESGIILVGVLALLILTLYWGFRFIGMMTLAAIYNVRPHPLRRHWKRWLIMPILLAALFITARTDWPARLAFSIYRPQMEAMAKQMLADAVAEKGPTRIGIYQFDHIRTQKNGQVRFYATRGSRGYGFLYSSFPTLGNIDDNWTSWSHK